MTTWSRSRRSWPSAPGLLAIVVLAAATSVPNAAQPRGVVEDWSHRHLVFADPGTYVQMLDQRVSHDRWLRWLDVQRNPRFRLQRLRRAPAHPPLITRKKRLPPPKGPQIHRDWSNVMGGGRGGGATGVGSVAVFPAKFSFDPSSKNCATDFVVFTTAAAGATSDGSPLQATGTFSAPPTPGDTMTITNGLYDPAQVLTLTADATVNTGLRFAVGGTAAEAATNLAQAIARNGGTVGMTATSFGAIVNVNSITADVPQNKVTTGATSGAFSWVSETSGTGAEGQPTIFALNQLYADTVANGGCQTPTQPVPATYWSYNTGDGAIADLSPALSFSDNGAQVAFTQRVGGLASLVLLKWSATSLVGTIGEPTAPASVSPADYRACVAPCMTVMTLGADNTNSSPFVDYSNDTLYVGDDSGRLHKFSGVFQGTPTEAGTPWPAAVTASASVLSSPVFDGTFVWIGSVGAGAGLLPRLHRVDSSAGVTSSAPIACENTGTSLLGVSEPPIVDPGLSRVYAFVSSDATCTSRSVYQFTIASFAEGAPGDEKTMGSDNGTERSFAGTFDDAYYTTGVGFLYACSDTLETQRFPTLWRIPADAANGLGTPEQGPTIGGGNDRCSPVSEIKSGGVDRIFVSVEPDANATGCAGDCVYQFDLSTAASFNTTSTLSTFDSGEDRFLSVSTSTNLSTTESTVETTLTALQAGTYHGMTIIQGSINPSLTSFTYTLRKSGVDQAITCTIASGASTCSDVSHSATYAAGDPIVVRIARNGIGDVTTTFAVQLGWGTSTAAAAGLSAPGGTGGIVVDNTVSGGGSQIYYATVRNPGIAVQASQAGLR